MAEHPLVALPVAVGVAARGRAPGRGGLGGVGVARKADHHLEPALVDHDRGVVHGVGIDLDKCAGRSAERLDERGVELAVLDLVALGEEQDEVARAEVELARAMVLKAVELGVVSAAGADLGRGAAEHELHERIGPGDRLHLRSARNVGAAGRDLGLGELGNHGVEQLGGNVVPNLAVGLELIVGHGIDAHGRPFSQ